MWVEIDLFIAYFGELPLDSFFVLLPTRKWHILHHCQGVLYTTTVREWHIAPLLGSSIYHDCQGVAYMYSTTARVWHIARLPGCGIKQYLYQGMVCTNTFRVWHITPLSGYIWMYCSSCTIKGKLIVTLWNWKKKNQKKVHATRKPSVQICCWCLFFRCYWLINSRKSKVHLVKSWYIAL